MCRLKAKPNQRPSQGPRSRGEGGGGGAGGARAPPPNIFKIIKS